MVLLSPQAVPLGDIVQVVVLCLDIFAEFSTPYQCWLGGDRDIGLDAW